MDEIDKKHAINDGFEWRLFEVGTDAETGEEGLNLKHKFERNWKFGKKKGRKDLEILMKIWNLLNQRYPEFILTIKRIITNVLFYFLYRFLIFPGIYFLFFPYFRDFSSQVIALIKISNDDS